MRFRKRKNLQYCQNKSAEKGFKQNHWTVMTNLVIRTSVLKRNLFQKLSPPGSSMINQSWLIKPLEE